MVGHGSLQSRREGIRLVIVPLKVFFGPNVDYGQLATLT